MSTHLECAMSMSKAQLAAKASRGFKQRYAAAEGAVGGARESAEGGWQLETKRPSHIHPWSPYPGMPNAQVAVRFGQGVGQGGRCTATSGRAGVRRPEGVVVEAARGNWRRRKMGGRNVRTRSNLATRACCACVAPAIRESAHADACACQGCRVGCGGRTERARGVGWGWGRERRVRRHTHRNEQPEARRHGAHQRRGSHGWPQTPKLGANPDRTQAFVPLSINTTAGDFRLM